MSELRVDLLEGRNTLGPALLGLAAVEEKVEQGVHAIRTSMVRMASSAASNLRSMRVGWTELNSAMEVGGRLFRMAGAAGRFFLEEVDERRFGRLARGVDEARSSWGRLTDSVRHAGQAVIEHTGVVDAAGRAMNATAEVVETLTNRYEAQNEILREHERLLGNLPDYQRDLITRMIEGARHTGTMTEEIRRQDRAGDALAETALRLAAALDEIKRKGAEAAGALNGVFQTEGIGRSALEIARQHYLETQAGRPFNGDYRPSRRGRDRDDDPAKARAEAMSRYAEAVAEHQRRLSEIEADAFRERLEAEKAYREAQAQLRASALAAEVAAAAAESQALGDLKAKREQIAAAEAAQRQASITGAFEGAAALASAVGQAIGNRSTEAWIEALIEEGRVFASAATGDFIGAGLHQISAAKLFYAASQAGKSSRGGGGGGGAGSGGRTEARRTTRVREPEQATAATGGAPIIINVNGVAASRSEARAGLIDAFNTLARRNTGRRFDRRLTG